MDQQGKIHFLSPKLQPDIRHKLFFFARQHFKN